MESAADRFDTSLGSVDGGFDDLARQASSSGADVARAFESAAMRAETALDGIEFDQPDLQLSFDDLDDQTTALRASFDRIVSGVADDFDGLVNEVEADTRQLRLVFDDLGDELADELTPADLFGDVTDEATDAARQLRRTFDRTGDRISDDLEFDDPFTDLADDAEDVARDLSRSFDRTGDRIADDLDVGDPFDDLADDATQVSRILERSFDRTGDRIADDLDVGDPFDDLADDAEVSARRVRESLGSAFGRARAQLTGELDRVQAAARSAASGLASPFDRASSAIGSSFAGVRGRIGSDLDGVQAAARSAASGLSAPFDRAASGIGSAFSGVRGRVSSALGGLRDVASNAGSDIAEAFTGGADGFDLGGLTSSLASQIGGLGAVGGPVGIAAGAAGAAVAALFLDDLTAGITAGFNADRAFLRRQIQTGLSDVDLRRSGNAAGEAYSAGFGESLGEVADTAATIEQVLGDIDFGLDLTDATKQAEALRDLFGIEVADSVRVVQRLLANDLVNDAEEGFNLIAASQQRLGSQGEDLIDVLSEFAPLFNRAEIEGTQAFEFIARSIERGLFPNADKAGEAVEEILVRLTEFETAREPVEQLGLDFEELQRQISSGEGEDALQGIIRALLAVQDPAERSALTVELFGASLEQAADSEEALELALESFTDTTSRSIATNREWIESAEGLETGFGRLQREVEGLARIWGSFLDTQVERSFGAFDVVTGAIGDAGLGLFDLGKQVTGLGETSEEAARKQAELNRENRFFAARAQESRDAADRLKEGFDGIEDSASDSAEAIVDVDDALNNLFNFSYDQQLRSIAAAGDRAAEAAQGLDSSVVGLNGSIDVSTEEGRRLQESLERLSTEQQRNAQLFLEGKITADQFNEAQRLTRERLGEVTSAAGETAEEVDGLNQKYDSVDPMVRTVIDAQDNASPKIQGVRDQLDRTPRQFLIDINANTTFSPPLSNVQDTIRRIGGRNNNITRRAGGGPTPRGLTLVGEEGPELVRFDQPGYVFTAPETQRLMNESAGRSLQLAVDTSNLANDVTGQLAPLLAGRGGITIEQVMVDPGRSLWQELEEADAYYRAVAAS